MSVWIVVAALFAVLGTMAGGMAGQLACEAERGAGKWIAVLIVTGTVSYAWALFYVLRAFAP